MASRHTDLEKIIRGLEAQGVVARLNRKGGYTLKFPDGETDTISASTDPKALLSQRTMIRRHNLHWPLDPLPVPRKRPATRKKETTPVATATATAPAPIRPAAAQRIIDHVQDASVDRTTGDMAVTPQLAEEWLNQNTRNRKLSSLLVTKYADQMKQGLWHYDAEPIRFDKDGNLIDGQHRLWAIVESGTTQRFLVVRGLDTRAFVTIDTGKVRSFPDILSIEYPELIQLNRMASVTRAVYLWEAGIRGKYLKPSQGNKTVPNETMLDFFKANKEDIEAIVPEAHRISQKIPAFTATMVGLLKWIFEGIDVEDSDYFFDKLITGSGLEEGSPILALRRYAYRYAEGKNTRSGLPFDIAIAVGIKAWNAYRKGDDVKLLTYKSGGARPEMFPIPE